MKNPVIDESGNKIWYNENGRYHREDGPAIEYASWIKAWLINGNLHREDGPAYEGANGYKEYWINGKKLTKEQFKVYLRRNKL